MGSVCCCCFGNDEYRTLKRSESIRSSRSSKQTRITKQEQLLNTMDDIANSGISTIEMETTNKLTGSNTVPTTAIDSEDVQIEDKVTIYKHFVEERLTRFKTERCNDLKKNKTLTESIMQSIKLNESRIKTSESQSETIEKSIQAETTEETIGKLKQLLASFETQEEETITMVDDIIKGKDADSTKIKPEENIQDSSKRNDDLEDDTGREKGLTDKELKGKGKGFEQIRAKASSLQDSKQSDSRPKPKMEKDLDINVSGTVQIFHTQLGETMEKLKEDLQQYLNDKLENVHFINCNKTCDILHDHLLIIPCVIASRVGADAAHAIEDIPNPGNTALVLIHTKETHALPKLKSSLTLNEHKFKNLRRIFDLAFTKDRGFYRCDMNTENLDALCKFCKLIPVGERL